MPYTFKAEQWLPFPVELVFAFFADPGNLPLLMPAWQQPRIEGANYVPPPPRPFGGEAGDPAPRLPAEREAFAAGAGSRFTITFRPVPYSPIRISWDALITEFEWNSHFCDEQPRGPFGYWRHCHRVSEQLGGADGQTKGTTILDDLIYDVPGRLLPRVANSLANSLVVAPQIRSIFKYRQTRLEPCLEEFARKL